MTPVLTEQGKNLLLGALAGKTITFTKVQLGNGTAQDSREELVNPLLTVPLTKITVENDYVTLTAALTNGNVTAGFRVTEAGFFAQDPDDSTHEILYAIGHEDESTADYIPDKNNRVVEMEYSALLFIGKAQNIAAAINSSLVYAPKSDFDAHLADQNNPHGVTKEQIGLGNVPNLAPGDQTPAIEESTNLSNISSGEKMSVLLGKIKLAVSTLISHIGNMSNPHKCTAAQIGAAPKSHTHDATHINSGTLPVNRGGTGVSTYQALANILEPYHIVTGTYTGNGEHGSKYVHNALNFATTPKLLIVMPKVVDTSNAQAGFTVVNGVSNYNDLTIIWGDKYVYWWAINSAENQCNASGTEYCYFAIL